MRLNHIHVGVRHLGEAVAWLRRVWQVRPAFQNERMATFQFGLFILVLDLSDQDSAAIIGFESGHCDEDFQGVVKRGAVSLEEPKNRAWGARSAYLKSFLAPSSSKSKVLFTKREPSS